MNIHRHFIAQVFLKPEILGLTAVNHEHFLAERDRKLFKAIEDIAYKGEDVNIDSVSKLVGWKLSEVMEYSPSVATANWRYFEGEILEAYRRNVVLKAIEEIKGDRSLTADEMLEKIAQATTDVQIKALNRVKTGDEVFGNAIYRYEQRALGEKQDNISTGIGKLDWVFDGFKARRLYYIGGRPSQGKSALLMNFATTSNTKALFFTAESSGDELMDRIIICRGRLDNKQFQQGVLNEKDRMKLQEMNRYGNLFIYYDGDLDMQKISAIAYSYKKTHDIKIIFVDYLQLIRPRNLSIPRHEQVAEMSVRLKQLAIELNVPVVCAVQLRRDAESKRPILSDFSDSTQIERDADVAMLIHNYKIGEQDISELIVAKNRDGECKNVLVEFDKSKFYFQGLEEKEEARIKEIIANDKMKTKQGERE